MVFTMVRQLWKGRGGTDDLEQCGCTERGSYVDTCVGQDQTEKWWEKNVHAPHDMEKVRRSDGRCLPDFSSFFPVKMEKQNGVKCDGAGSSKR